MSCSVLFLINSLESLPINFLFWKYCTGWRYANYLNCDSWVFLFLQNQMLDYSKRSRSGKFRLVTKFKKEKNNKNKETRSSLGLPGTTCLYISPLPSFPMHTHMCACVLPFCIKCLSCDCYLLVSSLSSEFAVFIYICRYLTFHSRITVSGMSPEAV